MKKRIIQGVIFITGVFLFAVVLSPNYVGDKPDSRGVDSPSIVRDGESYRMYYAGFYIGSANGGPGSIHLATSPDGKTWEKYDGNPIIKRSWLTGADATSVSNPVVMKTPDNQYKCFYLGMNPSLEESICMAESDDGLKWSKFGDNPVFKKEMPLPTVEEVKAWTEEELENYLRSINMTEEDLRVPKVVWLEQAMKLIQESPSREFSKAEVTNAMVFMAWTMPDIELTEFRLSDRESVVDKLKSMTEGVGDLPPWTNIRQMSSEEIDALVEKLGVPDSAFEIDPEDILVHMLEFLNWDLNDTEALRYFKVVEPSALTMTRKALPELRTLVMEKLRNGGVAGGGFTDFDIIYDDSQSSYRMYFTGGGAIGHATSSDGIVWERTQGQYASGAITQSGGSKVTVAREADGRYLMVLLGSKKVGDEEIQTLTGLGSEDGMGWTTIAEFDIPESHNGDAVGFYSEGITDIELTEMDGEYCLYLGGERNGWDTPFPTKKELETMPVRELYEYANMVGFRISRWNRTRNYEDLSLAKTFLENPDDVGSIGDEKLRELAQAYWLEFDLTGKDLDKIDRELIVFAIRKALLKRTLSEYGRTVRYPTIEEIGKMTRPELVENASVYAVAGITDLDQASEEKIREELAKFSKLCEGSREYLDSLSQEELISIAGEYQASVKIDPRENLADEVENITTETISNALVSTLAARRANFLEQKSKELSGPKRLATRIGLLTSTDFTNWTAYEGKEMAGSVVTNNPSGRRNPLLKAEGEVSRAITILGWFAVGLGIINLFRHHGSNILKKGKNYMMSVSFFIAFFSAILIMAIYYPYYSKFIQVPNPYIFMQNFIAEPIIACILGLLGYYITSAAYRAFRVQNIEAAVMMFIAILCMLGNTPLLDQYSRSWFAHTPFDQLHFPYIRNWLMNSANAAVFRGLNFGISIGVVAMSIRIILGLEKGAFFEKL